MKVFFLLLFLQSFLYAQPPEFENFIKMDRYGGQAFPYELCGVIFSSGTRASVAVLRETNSGRMEIVKIGESLNDFKLVQVLPYAISFEKGGQLYRLFYHRPLREEMKSSGSRIKKELVYKTVLERLRSEWNLIFQKTEVIPYKLRNGVQGYKILKLPTNCYLSEIGIRENDIIFQINDIKLDESANFNSLYESLKDCRKFEINALRNGKLYNLVFSMK